jgi:hypothetical protein
MVSCSTVLVEVPRVEMQLAASSSKTTRTVRLKVLSNGTEGGREMSGINR